MNDRLVLDVSDLAPGELRRVDLGERSVLVCNVEGRYYALEDRCPHAAVPLSGGRLEGCLLECPFHGGKLDVRDGSPRAKPIRRPATIFPVRPVNGETELTVEIELGQDIERSA